MPGTKSNWIHEMSHVEVARYLETDDIALLPFGATEQHGAHAPMMLDTAWAMAAAEEAARKTNVLIAPPVHFGWSYSHMGFPGTLTLSAETIVSLAVDLCRSLVFHGFRKLILINGNRMVLQPLDIAAVRIRNDTGAVVAVVDAGLIAKEEVKSICASGAGALGHAGEAETSMILARFPQFTDMTKAVDGTSSSAANVTNSRFVRGHSQLDPEHSGNSIFAPTVAVELAAVASGTLGVRGNAPAASAEKGVQMVEAIAKNLADFIEEIRPMKPNVLKPPIPT